MDDQLDNDLQNRIREVFDNHEDATADEGWLLLRERFPAEQSKRRAFAWMWWSAAAILLAFLGIGLWIKSTGDKPGNTIVKVLKHQQRENLAIERTRKDTDGDTLPAAPKNLGTPQRANNYKAASLHPVSPAAGPVQVAGKYPGKVIPGLPGPDTSTKKTFIANRATDSSKNIINQTTAPQLAVNTAPQNNDQTSLVLQQKKPEKSIIAMFNDDKGEKATKGDDDKKLKKVNFGVYAATYFNYSKGSDNQVNVGAGLTSDIKISRNLKLVTGIAIAQNSLSYSGFPSAVASAKSNLYTPTNGPVSAFIATSTPTVKNYNASLVGLDIPLNIKYEFNPQKSDAYISMGLSSGTFIDESYTYKYNYPSFLSSTLQQTKDETTGNNFNSFYFAKTLNVAFGIGYPFGNNRLIIEPFLKYPLDGMGSQNLRFGAGGLNLKLSFKSLHK
jgi:hypothetical protein